LLPARREKKKKSKGEGEDGADAADAAAEDAASEEEQQQEESDDEVRGLRGYAGWLEPAPARATAAATASATSGEFAATSSAAVANSGFVWLDTQLCSSCTHQPSVNARCLLSGAAVCRWSG
jgi:ABC-type Zn2+ transport system substrate-binding protein/surface adhesin